MGKGVILEGKSTEIGALMQQDTEGKVEILRKKTTNQSDDGVDYEKIIKEDEKFKYFEYQRELKNKNGGEK